MAEFVAGRGTTALGIIGTVLGSLGVAGNGGIFPFNNAHCSGDGASVNRYEAQQQARIAELETEVKLRDANTFTMGEMGKLRDYVDSRFKSIEHELCDQKVYNATCNQTISCIAGQVNTLMGLTKVVIPNASICPGFGNVTVTPSTTATTG